ncbi:DUF7854 family protein [Haladaptatus salinisoli]|uniref:DUF7854 family protein n=1 Tax=Haladaptatus salinisoli TaxID=2884876 RepID=UPI001D0BD58E|nr:hypothetical protein [Haladaptatus salinisoli]
MDRISALRNIEDALSDFESDENGLKETERRVVAVLRTYATEFESERDLSAYRARGDERADGIVVVADSKDEARERVGDLFDAEDLEFEMETI